MSMVALIALALLGAPLFAVIASSAMLGFASEDTDLSVIGIEIYRLAETPVLLAIPLFAFAGYLLGESQAPARLFGSPMPFLVGFRAVWPSCRWPLALSLPRLPGLPESPSLHWGRCSIRP